MRKILAFIIFAFIISLSFPQLAAEQPAVFTMEAPAGPVQVDEEFSITVFLEPGDEPIDAFIIYNLTWSADCFDILSVEPGWWEWLFDGGKIGEDHIKWTQAGEKTKASEKQVACIFNCIAEKGGNSEVTISIAKAISGGPEVPTIWESTSIEVEEINEPEDPPNNNNPPGSGGEGDTPPVEEEPEEEPEPEQRDKTTITEGEFIFSSEQKPEEEPTVDDKEDPVNTTTSSEQNETQEDRDKEDTPLPLSEIMVAGGGLIGVILIIAFIIKRKRTPSKKEPEDEEIIIGK